MLSTNRVLVMSTYFLESKPLASGKVLAKDAVLSRCFITGTLVCSKEAASSRSYIPYSSYFVSINCLMRVSEIGRFRSTDFYA